MPQRLLLLLLLLLLLWMMVMVMVTDDDDNTEKSQNQGFSHLSLFPLLSIQGKDYFISSLIICPD